MKLLIDFDPIKRQSKITSDQPITPPEMVILIQTTLTQVMLNMIAQKEDRRILTPQGGINNG